MKAFTPLTIIVAQYADLTDAIYSENKYSFLYFKHRNSPIMIFKAGSTKPTLILHVLILHNIHVSYFIFCFNKKNDTTHFAYLHPHPEKKRQKCLKCVQYFYHFECKIHFFKTIDPPSLSLTKITSPSNLRRKNVLPPPPPPTGYPIPLKTL